MINSSSKARANKFAKRIGRRCNRQPTSERCFRIDPRFITLESVNLACDQILALEKDSFPTIYQFLHFSISDLDTR